jgi:hypothetical protein
MHIISFYAVLAFWTLFIPNTVIIWIAITSFGKNFLSSPFASWTQGSKAHFGWNLKPA